MRDANGIDRITIRQRPSGPALMRQTWGKLLFMHWPVPPEILRPLIPEPLSIDTFDGQAWIGEVPFTIWGARASFMPPLPGLRGFHELNVRTYVHLDGVPGVWFLSLDANHRLGVWGARTFFYLPYFNADITLEDGERSITYALRRKDRRGAPASFDAKWEICEMLAPESPSGSLEFFLTERYCLYAAGQGKLYRSRIFHRPWPLQRAELGWWQSTMIASHGLPEPRESPLVHYSEGVVAEIWRLHEVT